MKRNISLTIRRDNELAIEVVKWTPTSPTLLFEKRKMWARSIRKRKTLWPCGMIHNPTRFRFSPKKKTANANGRKKRRVRKSKPILNEISSRKVSTAKQLKINDFIAFVCARCLLRRDECLREAKSHRIISPRSTAKKKLCSYDRVTNLKC